MDTEARTSVYRGMICAFALAIYNGEDWDKQAVAAQLGMGGPNVSSPGELPETLTDEAVLAAIDRIFERADI